MSLENEIDVYNKASVSSDNCEIDAYDKIIFPKVVRKREIEIVLDLIEKIDPENILDYGCGGGWLTKVLVSHGYNVTAVDLNEVLIENAKKLIPEANFIAADCTNLPLEDNSFDLVIGMGILHHMDLDKALTELKRITRENKYLIFMEPNKLNPPGFIGRKFSPLDIHTEDEEPFSPFEFKKMCIRNGFKVKKFFCILPYSFALSYVVGKSRFDGSNFLNHLCKPIELSERVYEKIPLFKHLSSTIVIVIQK